MVDAELAKLKRKWRGQLYSTSYSSFARGATIWVRNGVPFKLLEQRKDVNGRYIFVRGTLDGVLVILGSVYAPNTEQDKFLVALNTVLADWEGYPCLIGGDFNMVLDVALDRSHPPLQNTNSRKLADALRGWADGWGLGDAWRHIHSNSREYSFFSHPHSLHTRIDRIFCSLHLLQAVKATT